MITGCVIAESLRPGAVFDPPGVRIRRIARLDVAASARGSQPAVWTAIDFAADDDAAEAVAERLAGCLSAEGGWYADFRAGDEHVVVFAGAVFRYRVGDAAGRAAAVAHGRAAGVPEHQLDWAD
ncbi:hypothetical protein [Dactylosporangium sp. CA-092794]|uniref:hypothetical protein n=1 Tax=Dactylosporangium sp. CA-092794 TaxID=3239929 RepID=UPI003D90B7CA